MSPETMNSEILGHWWYKLIENREYNKWYMLCALTTGDGYERKDEDGEESPVTCWRCMAEEHNRNMKHFTWRARRG